MVPALWATGCRRPGSSRLPTVRWISSEPRYSNESGRAALPGKTRAAQCWRREIGPAQRLPPDELPKRKKKAPKRLPNAFWHMRQ